MNISIVTSVKDGFHEEIGSYTTTLAFLSIDSMLFSLGNFYDGDKSAAGRLDKVEQLQGCLSEKDARVCNISIVTSVEDDFDKFTGPTQNTLAFLSIDGKLFPLGNFYEGPGMSESTANRFGKVLELEQYLGDMDNT